MNFRSRVFSRAFVVVLAAALPAAGTAHAEINLNLFRAATCDALVSEYVVVRDVNKNAVQEMRALDGDISVGAATLASASPSAAVADDKSEQGAIRDLAAYRHALLTVAGEKKCSLPAGDESRVKVQ